MAHSRWTFLAVLALVASACDQNGGGNPQVMTRGLSVESTDGKYLGELVGVGAPGGAGFGNYATCAWIYRPQIDSIFGLQLETGMACNPVYIEFTDVNCDYSQGVYTDLRPSAKWVVIESATGSIYAPTTQPAAAFTVAARLQPGANGRECIPLGSPETRQPAEYYFFLEPTGEVVDIGQPPAMLVVKE